MEEETIEMITEDANAMRKAGNELAIASIRVAKDYDGIHRLMLAVSKWCAVIADEGKRKLKQ